MLLQFKGMALSQKQYVSKAGNKGNSIMFIELPSAKMFQVSSKEVLDDKNLQVTANWSLEGVLSAGQTGLYFRADKIVGSVK